MTQRYIRAAAGLGVIRRLWLKVREPRVVAVVQCFVYLGLVGGGVSALLWPPNTLEGAVGSQAMFLLAVLLTAGGGIGAVATLPGWWWLEQVALSAVTSAALIYALIVAALQVESTGNRLLQFSFVVAVLGSQIIRWVKIRRTPYDPARPGRS